MRGIFITYSKVISTHVSMCSLCVDLIFQSSVFIEGNCVNLLEVRLSDFKPICTLSFCVWKKKKRSITTCKYAVRTIKHLVNSCFLKTVIQIISLNSFRVLSSNKWQKQPHYGLCLMIANMSLFLST